MEDLKAKVIRGGFAKLCGQAVNFGLRFAYIAIMARLLRPEDFGLLAMVTAVTGVYDLFTTAGLSLATVQRPNITQQQISNLFWVNLLVGTTLWIVCFATAPVLVAFYGEPRLFWVTIAIGAGFVFNAAGVQHSALLQRQMRYVDLSVVEVSCRLASYVVGIGLALAGFGYWALVGSAIASPAVSSALLWFFSAWLPGLPRRGADIRSMLSFGGTVTLNNLIVYAAYNLDKLLIGRVWGPGALGIYGTAYQLINLPTSSVTGAVGGVAFSALARLQEEPVRLKNYFLKGLSLVISITAPVTIFLALFAEDVVRVVLGPRWAEAAVVFRCLAPTILVFSFINPTGWLLQSVGLQVRSLWIAVAIAPLAIGGYLLGLPYGPVGVATGFSTAMTLWLVPHIFWSLHKTAVSPREFFLAVSRPLLASALAAGLAFAAIWLSRGRLESPFLRLALAGTVMIASYVWILLFAMGQKSLYLGSLKSLASPGSARPMAH